MRGLRLGLSLTGGAAFSPSTLFAGGYQGSYYDPNDLSTVWADTAGTTPASVNGAVARVDDKSGNGNHLVQATAGNRPLLKLNGAVYSLLFDGVDDYFNITNCLTLLTGWTAGTGLFAAKTITDPPAANRGGIFGYFAASDGGDVYATSAGAVQSSFLTSARKVNIDPGVLTNWHENGVRSTNGDFRYEFDGTEIVNTATNTFAATTGSGAYPKIGENGNPNYYEGHLGRLLFINRTLSAGDMASARTWIAAGYGGTL